MKQNTTAGVTVLYRPGGEHIRNLATYCDQLKRLYVVDNSDDDNYALIRREIPADLRTKITYLSNHGNRGIAQALNRGAQAARKDGHAYLLTMDQDTRVPEGTVAALRAVLQRCEDAGERLGLVAAHAAPPDEVSSDYIVPDPNALSVDYPLIVPTSGNLIRLDAHSAVGGFDEGYFIDDVDFEYCLKLKRNGYRVAWLPHLLVAHHWGAVTRHDFLFWKNWFASHHSPARRYYITRNRLYTLRRYHREFPEMKPLYRRMTREEWRGILLFENQRFKKIALAMLGTLHFLLDARVPWAASPGRRQWRDNAAGVCGGV